MAGKQAASGCCLQVLPQEGPDGANVLVAVQAEVTTVRRVAKAQLPHGAPAPPLVLPPCGRGSKLGESGRQDFKAHLAPGSFRRSPSFEPEATDLE